MDIPNEMARLMRLVLRLDARSHAHEAVLKALIQNAPHAADLRSAWASAAEATATSVEGPLALVPEYQHALQIELNRMRALLEAPGSASPYGSPRAS